MAIDKNTAGGTVASIFFFTGKTISTADSFLQPGTFNFVQTKLDDQ